MTISCLKDRLEIVENETFQTEVGLDVGLIAMTITTSILSFAIVIGNGLIIISVIAVKKLRQPANYLIVSLALSDFLVGAVVLPIAIAYDAMAEWIFGSMICDLHVSFDVICCTASIMNLCMISIDRYLIITKPMTYPKKRTGKLMLIMIATAWLVSCLIILPALFGFTENVKDSPGWIKPTIIINETNQTRTAKVNHSNGIEVDTSNSNERSVNQIKTTSE